MDIPLTRKQKKAIYIETYMVKYREENKEAILSQRMIYLEKTLICSCGVEVKRNATPTNLEAQKSTGAAPKLITQHDHTQVIIKLIHHKYIYSIAL